MEPDHQTHIHKSDDLVAEMEINLHYNYLDGSGK